MKREVKREMDDPATIQMCLHCKHAECVNCLAQKPKPAVTSRKKAPLKLFWKDAAREVVEHDANPTVVAEKYGVSRKTVVRWAKIYTSSEV